MVCDGGQNLLFVYVPDLILASIFPSVVRSGGGSVVTVRGSGFIASRDLSCRFGLGLPVSAVWRSASQIDCVVPGDVSGNVTVDVSNDGIFWVSSSIKFDDSPLLNRSKQTHSVQILNIIPSFCPTHGGSSVNLILSVSFFGNVICSFASIGSSPAVRVGNSSISCVCPAGAPGLIYLNILNEMAESQAVTHIHYVKPPQIVSAIPSVLSPSGGESILLLGSHFLMDCEISCFFDNLKTVGKFVSSNQIYCVSPMLTGSHVKLQVGFSGFVSESFVSLVVSFKLESLKLFPSIGYSSGGSIVTVLGDMFKSSSSTFCKFGSVVTPASVLNVSCVTCTLPPSPSIGIVQFRVLLDFAFDNAVFVPFLYVDQPVASAMMPTCGPRSGGTRLTIKVSNILPGSTFVCMFGSTAVASDVLGTDSSASGRISCLSPPFERASIIDVFVSHKLYGDALGSVRFLYFDDFNVASVIPSRVEAGMSSSLTIIGRNFLDSAQARCRDDRGSSCCLSPQQLLFAPLPSGIRDLQKFKSP
jgi:hypothetical protein